MKYKNKILITSPTSSAVLIPDNTYSSIYTDGNGGRIRPGFLYREAGQSRALRICACLPRFTL